MSDNIIGYILNESTTEPMLPSIIRVTPNIVEFKTNLQEMEEQNRNGRRYPRSILEKALASSFIQERLKTRTWYGEAGHPADADVKRQLRYDHKNFSHIVLDYEISNTKISGTVQTTSTEAGKDMRGLIIDNQSLVAFSSRGYGPVIKKGNDTIVKDPYILFCYDWVVHPSHKNSYAHNTAGLSVNESLDFIHGITRSDLTTLLESSKNLSEAADQLAIDFATSYLQLSPKCDQIKLKSNSQTVVLNLEESMQREINFALLKHL